MNELSSPNDNNNNDDGNSYSSSIKTNFEIRVAKETFKFNAAHFVAFPGFRERLHGHNYTVAVRLLGSNMIGSDGYVLDFGDVKKVTKKICTDLNENFLCPMYSNVMDIQIVPEKKEEGEGGKVVVVKQSSLLLNCEDGAEFQFPKNDCVMLPIVHATAEELAIYIWGKIVKELNVKLLRSRGIHTMEVTCAEAPGQEALFRMSIPDDESKIDELCDVRKYVSTNQIQPMPCFSSSSVGHNRTMSCCNPK